MGEQFIINHALVVPQFSDDENILPHAVDISGFEHFVGLHIPIAPEWGIVDILIGQSDKALQTVHEEHGKGVDPEEPNYVLDHAPRDHRKWRESGRKLLLFGIIDCTKSKCQFFG